jgi:hypothetical protein
MRKFINYLMCGRWHGKALKCIGKNDLGRAMKCYENSLEFARKIEDDGMIALELENIANLCICMEMYEKGEFFAEEALFLYNKNIYRNEIYVDGKKRVVEIIEKIEAIKQNKGSGRGGQPLKKE